MVSVVASGEMGRVNRCLAYAGKGGMNRRVLWRRRSRARVRGKRQVELGFHCWAAQTYRWRGGLNWTAEEWAMTKWR